MDCPPLRIVHVPTPVGPGAFGAKMAGELTNAIVAPAVANAVADAVGARVTSLPLTAERIFLALGAPRRPRPRRSTTGDQETAARPSRCRPGRGRTQTSPRG